VASDAEDRDDALNVGLLLFIPYRALENHVFRRLAEAGFDDVTPAQGRVMERIGPAGTRLTELAEAAQVTKQTAGFLVDQLERTGYVRRTPDPSDARARLVRVAERGAAAQPIAAAAVAEMEAQWRAHLGERRWTQLREALTRLREITDPYR
jgi:DNA-binding MarR family transcriptional regulator